jgi:tetratricopeptide (TPR) repeat protein
VKDFSNDNITADKIIYWYTKETFFYRMINEILRKNDILQFFKIRYALGLIHNSLKKIYKQEKIDTLYRSAKILDVEFLKLNGMLKKKQNTLFLQLRGFFSTSKNLDVAKKFGKVYPPKEGITYILYEITVGKENYDKIFGISEYSHFKDEEEYLLSFNSCVKLEKFLESDDPKFDYKIQCSIVTREKIDKFVDERTLNGTKLFQEIKDLNYKVDNFYLLHLLDDRRLDLEMEKVLNETKITKDNESNYYNFKGILYYNKGKYDEALQYYMKALEIKETKFGKDHPDTATTKKNLESCKKMLSK